MRKDPTEFRERFQRWKKGEKVYEAGLPKYDDGKEPDELPNQSLPDVPAVDLQTPSMFTSYIDRVYNESLAQEREKIRKLLAHEERVRLYNEQMNERKSVADQRREIAYKEQQQKDKRRSEQIQKDIASFLNGMDDIANQSTIGQDVVNVGQDNSKRMEEIEKNAWRLNKLYLDSVMKVGQLYGLYGGVRTLTKAIAPKLGSAGLRLANTNFAGVSDADLFRYNAVGSVVNPYQFITDKDTDWGGFKRPLDAVLSLGNWIGVAGAKNWLVSLGKFGTALDNTADAIGMGTTITDAAEATLDLHKLYKWFTNDNKNVPKK